MATDQFIILPAEPVVISRPIPLPTTVVNYKDFTPDEIDMPLANTEYSYTFPAGTRAFDLQARTGGTLKIKRMTGGKFKTLFAGGVLSRDNIDPAASVTIILESTSASQIVEVLYWT